MQVNDVYTNPIKIVIPNHCEKGDGMTTSFRLQPKPDNTHLLRKGKCRCTADLLFDWFGFSCFVELKL